MKNILCYGDSNTWGYIPLGNHTRYSDKIRYPMVLQSLLGEDYKVFEDGLCGRCICNNYQNSDDSYNGSVDFPRKIQAFDSLEYVVIMLGTNDMKDEFKSTSLEAALALENIYINQVYTYFPNAQIIIVCPKPIKQTTFPDYKFAEKKSENFETDYKIIADKYHCPFVTLEDINLGADGLHFTNEDHLKLAKKLANVINN